MDITVIRPSNAGVRRRTRRAAVICAVAVASALWAVIEPGLGLDLRGPLLGTAETMDVGLAHVVSGSLLASLAGWALLAALERAVVRPRRTWTAIALLVQFASLSGPMSGTGVTTANRVSLVLLHLAVGVTLIPLLYRTATVRTDVIPSYRTVARDGRWGVSP